MLAVLRWHKLIQLARCKFCTVGTLHTVMDAILYWYGPVCSKRPVGRGVAFTRVWKNPANPSRTGPEFGWYEKVNQKSGRFANVPFHSRMNRKGRSLSGTVRLLQVHASAFHLLSWLLSPSILGKLSFRAGVFWFFGTSFLNLISVSPKTLFFFKFHCRYFFEFS